MKMGRVYGTIICNNTSLHTLFDTGAVHNYITRGRAKGLSINRLPKPFTVGIGGERREIQEACFIYGELQGKRLFCWALVIEELGLDEQDKEIDMLFGAIEMQRWNIRIDPLEERLDLSGFREEFIEY
ncbi:MAG: hypothetical protein QHJ81_09245 [Anaerolineae bacterium]|nr:hypothetical protein [Anaerolineae bacterium]